MARRVRIASCSVEHYFSKDEREQCMRLVDEAGQRKADIVCLPEFVGADNRKGNWIAEPVPGPTVQAFAALAAKHRMYVVLPLMEDVGEAKAYNTAVLIGRSGEVVGKYRKTHICLPEFGEGECTLAGDELPVFKTDFGTIAISTCMDIHYPELYAVLTLKGAEIIFWPSGALDYTGDLIESLVNARAIDNQVVMVPSHHIQMPYLAGKPYGRSRIVDCMGRTRADTGHFPGVAVADVDLDETYPMWYSGGMLERYPTMRATIRKTRRPELYGELTKPVPPGDIR
ncbi:MAG: carbon-nitrogen hydrolase family protein [Planctomycetota bacterium]|nr:carbon-nitrogen hydrolase family protein [Planctomycetota bacterium]